MVRTDGYGIDFVLAGPKIQVEGLPDLDLSDFSINEIIKSTICGVSTLV
jgi:hypothetical protein